MAEPDATLAFRLQAGGEDEIDTERVVVTVDGRDVTPECAVRLPRLWPANRADYAHLPAGGWSPGRHEVTVSWDGTLARAWHFEVSPDLAAGS